MPYTVTYDPTYPNGATEPARNAPLNMKTIEAMFVERIEDLLGTDFTDDPMAITKIDDAASISSKLLYKSEYDAGNSGIAKTLDFVVNGPVQKLAMTASCTLTIANPPAGSSGILRTTFPTGGWSLTFPSNWNTQANIPLTVIPNSGTCTIYSWYSDGTIVYLQLVGTGYDVS